MKLGGLIVGVLPLVGCSGPSNLEGTWKLESGMTSAVCTGDSSSIETALTGNGSTLHIGAGSAKDTFKLTGSLWPGCEFDITSADEVEGTVAAAQTCNDEAIPIPITLSSGTLSSTSSTLATNLTFTYAALSGQSCETVQTASYQR